MLEIPIKILIESGQENFTTEKIEGKLNSIIVESNNKISIIIRSIYGYLIFHEPEHSGVEYYCPRAILQRPKSNLMTPDSFDNFLLNEPIEIMVSGPKNEDVRIILRFEEIYNKPITI